MGSLSLSCVCVLTVGVGCSAPPTEAEDLGQMELAVYPGCATVTADDDIYSSYYCSSEWSDSPNTSYDHGASCPGRWVVEFTGAVDYISNWGQDGWGDTMPTTSTTCAQARWESDGYWYDGTWNEMGKVTATGNWVGGVRTWSINNSDQGDIDADATKVRVASKAWLATFPLQTKKKARSWVGGTSCFGG